MALKLNAAELDEVRIYLAEHLPVQALKRLDRKAVARVLRGAIERQQVLKERLKGVAPGSRDLEKIVQDAVGLGDLAQLVNDASVSSILVLGGGRVMCEVGGTWTMPDLPEWTDEDLRRVAQALTLRGGGHLDPGQPYFDGVFIADDGAPIRVNISALGDDGELPFTIAIRRVRSKDELFTLGALVEKGSMSRGMAVFLRSVANAPVGTLIIGPVGTGKSTLLQALELEMPRVPIAVVDDRTEYMPVNDGSFIQRTPPPPPMTSLDRPHADLSMVLWLTLRQHARVLIVTEVRGAETASMLRESHARWATFCTFHADSPEAAARRMVALARTDSWWARSPYSGARDADVYQDIARSFPVVILTDVVRDGEQARYMVRGVYQAHMAPGDQEPEFETLFQYEGDGTWYQAPQLPTFPSRVSPQTIQPTLLIAKQGLACHQRGDLERAKTLLEQAVRQTRRPDPRWLAVLRELADGRGTELMHTAQTAWEQISEEGGRKAHEQILNDVRRSRPTLYAFIELVEMTSKGRERRRAA